ncbi:MAG TPA: NAD-dependent epimerase/dehydratase family protein [Candidatus Limnocylindrales bacterium]
MPVAKAAAAKKPRARKATPAVEPLVVAVPDAAPAPASTAAPRRRIWVSGGSGFVGRAVVRLLVERGDDVTAPVRDPRRAEALAALGATVVEDALTDVRALTETLRDFDAGIHAAGDYRVGITREHRGAMWDANVGLTTRVLDAAEDAHLARLVYVSTVAVFGNTHGRVVDETYRRDLRDGFVSWYDETKYGAHEVVEQRIARGGPVVIVQPSQVYGPGDHTGFGEQLWRAYRGKLAYRALPGLGVGLVHADDLAAGIVAALDRGRVGESYVLSGPRVTFDEAVAIAAQLGDRKVPFAMPEPLIRAMRPFGAVIGQPNLREVLSASLDVTYWASAEKAERELGFQARSIEDGLRATFFGEP